MLAVVPSDCIDLETDNIEFMVNGSTGYYETNPLIDFKAVDFFSVVKT